MHVEPSPYVSQPNETFGAVRSRARCWSNFSCWVKSTPRSWISCRKASYACLTASKPGCHSVVRSLSIEVANPRRAEASARSMLAAFSKSSRVCLETVASHSAVGPLSGGCARFSAPVCAYSACSSTPCACVWNSPSASLSQLCSRWNARKRVRTSLAPDFSRNAIWSFTFCCSVSRAGRRLFYEPTTSRTRGDSVCGLPGAWA